jgi:sulfite exporter TauE/SafE
MTGRRRRAWRRMRLDSFLFVVTGALIIWIALMIALAK